MDRCTAGGAARATGSENEMEAKLIVINNFFARKLKIIVLTVLTYAALC